MANLKFTAEGQAEVLAAQESLRKSARDYKQEVEAGAKATDVWDESWQKIKRSGESALRSIQSEQEKIVDRINSIKDAQEKGLIPPKEAEQSLVKLRQLWVDVDEATVKAKEKTRDYEQQQARLKSAGEAALGAVRTELELIESQIKDVEAAADAGLIPPEEAELALSRLNDKYEDVEQSIIDAEREGSKLAGVIVKAFDPLTIAKWGLSFIGVKAIIGQIKTEIDDIQAGADKRFEAFLQPKERAESLDNEVESAREKLGQQEKAVADREKDLQRATELARQAGGERQSGLSERIGDMQLRLLRAQEDRAEAVRRAEESKQDAQKQLERAREDARLATTPGGRRSAARRVGDAEERLRDTEASGGSLKSIDRRIADLEREIARADAERQQGSAGVTDNAQLALSEARAALADQKERLAALEAERAEFQATPESKRYEAVEQRGGAIDEAFRKLAGLADAGQLSSGELTKFADIFRELGQGELSRKLRGWVERIDDGTITVDEVIEQLKATAANIKQREQATTVRSGGEFDAGDVLPGRPLTTEERGQVYYIEQLIGELKSADERADKARQDQIRLLEQLLAKDDGVSVGP
jgi:DNA repair exonuclease SbcCD ATPase subunit